MRRFIVVLALLMGIIIVLGSSASATEAPSDAKVCYDRVVDKEAYDEKVVDKEATPGSPEVAEVSHIVHHEAVTEVRHHAAVTHTEYHFAKFTRERTNKNNKGWSDYGPWSKYIPETHTSWELNTTPIGSPQFHSSGKNGNTKWERQWQAQFDGQTRSIVDKEAYDETVTVKDAYDEKVIDVQFKPAVPATEEVSHIVHHDATYKNVEVPCPPVATEPPVVNEPPVVTPPVEKPPVEPTPKIGTPVSFEKPAEPFKETQAVLPNTGGPSSGLALAGIILFAFGVIIVTVEARRRTSKLT